MAVITTNNLSIGYKKNVVQSGLNLTANQRDLICLIGTNGAGKSTLLRTLAGLQPSLGGSISINGNDLSSLNNHQRAKLISLVLTDQINISNTTIFELVAMGRFPYTNWRGEMSGKDIEIINQAIENVNLTHKRNCKINEISDGEKQRAVIAKALAQDTPLILLDEPTAHLDLPNRIEIMMLLRKLSVTMSKTIILITHELEIALQTADYIWLMKKEGISVGIPEDMMLDNTIQATFNSPNYYFNPTDGHCTIKPLMGTMEIAVTADNGAEQRKAWLTRALNRTGITVVEQSDYIIHCHPDHYTINHTTTPHTTIQSVLQYIYNN